MRRCKENNAKRIGLVVDCYFRVMLDLVRIETRSITDRHLAASWPPECLGVGGSALLGVERLKPVARPVLERRRRYGREMIGGAVTQKLQVTTLSSGDVARRLAQWALLRKQSGIARIARPADGACGQGFPLSTQEPVALHDRGIDLAHDRVVRKSAFEAPL